MENPVCPLDFRYGRKAIKEIFGETNKLQYLLDVEAALASAHFAVSQLSGGEQQRIAIARAVAKRPDVLLCDEPTGALDYETGLKVLEVLADVNQRLGTTVAVITHNAAIAAMADRVIRMRSGRITRVEENARRARPSELQW